MQRCANAPDTTAYNAAAQLEFHREAVLVR